MPFLVQCAIKSVLDPETPIRAADRLLDRVSICRCNQRVYGHCPRALKFSNLWDAEIIERNRKDSPVG